MFIPNINPILNTDSYKPSFYKQLPPGTTAMFAYIESRGGRFDRTLFFGLQAFVRAYLTQKITRAHIEEAETFSAEHGIPFNRPGFERIVDVHRGYWPVSIWAAPEGSVIPTGNALVTIQSTDPELPWVASYIETMLLRAIWYPTTVATLSWHGKQLIKSYLDRTSDAPEAELPFKLHDFGARAATTLESAGIGGMAHLVNFSGTDTIAGILAAKQFYGADTCGFSIPASEHSTITAWGREGEADAYANMITQFGKPGKIFACVSDSYDLWNAIDALWGGSLRQQVIDSGATLVVRPDSGDPVFTPVEAVLRLAETFGTTVNSRGYRVLDTVRVIQGDGVDLANIDSILYRLELQGFSASNIAFGMGGKLLQSGLDRDTQRFAQKASAARVKGEWRDIYKDPVTDPGKASKRGMLDLVHTNDNYRTVSLFDPDSLRHSVLECVYDSGYLPVPVSFDTVRARAAAALDQAPLREAA